MAKCKALTGSAVKGLMLKLMGTGCCVFGSEKSAECLTELMTTMKHLSFLGKKCQHRLVCGFGRCRSQINHSLVVNFLVIEFVLHPQQQLVKRGQFRRRSSADGTQDRSVHFACKLHTAECHHLYAVVTCDIKIIWK